jgi:mono/diheme cytochrome c family protein
MNGRFQISPRRIEIGLGLFATALIAIGLLFYAWQEPQRIEQAQAAQLATDLNAAMNLYAENCAVCHGLAGEGIGATPPLDSAALAASDPDSLAKIIARGLYNTAMPAWSQEDGGPLSDYQIGELVNLIQFGDWTQVQARVVNLGLAPMVPFSAEADPGILEQVAQLPGGELLAAGISLYAQECVACHGADGLGTSLAPALNDPVVREQTAEELTRSVVYGVSGTLMAPWENALSPAEIEAVINLVQNWDQVPSGAIPEPDRAIPVTAESLALGEQIYTTTCTGCHGAEGEGTQRAPSLNVKSFLEDTSDGAIEQIVTLGVSGTSMPAWGDRISEAEIQAVVGFIRSWEPTAPEVAQPSRVRGPWWQAAGSPAAAGVKEQQLPSGGTTTGHTPGTGETGGQSQGSGAGQAGASQAAGNANADAANHTGGAPWATPATPQSWWDSLDPRSLALAGGLVLASLVLILLAVIQLLRLPKGLNPNSVSK